MTEGLRPLVAGNWKMNGVQASLSQATAICSAIGPLQADFALCLPATLIVAAAQSCAGSGLMIGAQNCHPNAAGAHTGEISAEMLKDAGARLVIVGHSERRQEFGETDQMVHAKVGAVFRAGLAAIVCVGETQEQRHHGKTLEVIGRQLQGSIPPVGATDHLIVAYEPVWAIGTGLTPTTADIAEVHAFVRAQLGHSLGDRGRSVKLLYGGSVKPENAAQLMAVANVNGALVGGASLKAEDFLKISACYA
jgi:triosephosphate isomerase